MTNTTSSTGPVGTGASGISRAAVRLAVLSLLAILCAQMFLSTRQESQTFDESDHLYAGYEYWKHADFGRNPEHPPLAKLVAALGILSSHSKEPKTVPGTYFKRQDFIEASRFLYGGNADSLLARARGMMLLFPLVLAIGVFAAGSEMFGPVAGLLALALFVFEPMVLANGSLVTTDMALSCTMFASVYAYYRYLKRPTPLRLAVLAVAVGLTPVAKQSGVFVYLILIVIAAGELLLRSNRSEDKRAFGRRAASLAVPLLVAAAAGYFLLWAFYGFRYSARPVGLQMAPTLDVFAAAIPGKVGRGLIFFCAHHHLLPEAYLFGWADILQIPGVRVSFLLGKLYIGGKWFLFPLLFLLKSTLALLVLVALVPFARLWRYRREFLFLAVPAAIYLLLAMRSGFNAEARYILPVYPFLMVLAGAAAWEFARRSRGWAIAATALFVFAAASSLHAFPDYLAYVNEAFGGPSNSYRIANDSNGDWAQGLKWTKAYIDANHITDCWFDYSDPAIDPAYYGIPCRPLTSGWVHRGVPGPTGLPATLHGTVFISSSELGGHLWGPGEMNPYEQFSHLRPDAAIGNVVLVYHGVFDVPLLSAYSHIAAARKLTAAGQMPQAVAEAEQAAQLAPVSADILAGLAGTLSAAGKTAEAGQASAVALHLRQTIHPEFAAMR